MRSPRWLVAGLAVLLLVPLVVALVALRSPRWYPVLDNTMTELRVRDVGTGDTPLIGLPGRIGGPEHQGSHPGPLSFYLLAPTYRLLGSSAWALQAGALVLAAAAGVATLVLAARRGGARLVTGAAVATLLLWTSLGFSVLAHPWNPYMPVLWWVPFLLACWGVARRDLALLPVAVAIGSFCAQTHLPYVALTVGMGLGSLALAAWADRSPDGRRALVRPVLVAAAVGVLLWSPVVIDQATVEPGNAETIASHFLDPPEEAVGLGTGVRVALVHLDVTAFGDPVTGGGSLVDRDYDPEGPVGPGLVLLAVWAASAAVAVRRRLERLVPLHLVVAGALVLGAVSAGNILGKVWYYLTLWAWGTTALAVLAVVLTVGAVLEGRMDSGPALRLRRASAAALGVAVLVGSAHLAVDAADARPPDPTLSDHLHQLMGPLEDALRTGEGAADGPDGRYVVTWSDALHIGSEAYGLVSELERDGFDAGVRSWARVPVTPHRVIPDGEETAVVHFASGPFIDRWRREPGAVEAAHLDPRTPAQRAEYDRIADDLRAELTAAGHADLADLLETNVFGVGIDPRLDADQQVLVDRLLVLGLPISIFILPPGAP